MRMDESCEEPLSVFMVVLAVRPWEVLNHPFLEIVLPRTEGSPFLTTRGVIVELRCNLLWTQGFAAWLLEQPL